MIVVTSIRGTSNSTYSLNAWLNEEGKEHVYYQDFLAIVGDCVPPSHDCDVNAVCSNSVGSYDCTCKSGYTGDGRNCTDVDECALGTHTCDTQVSGCVNEEGTFTCECVEGYFGPNSQDGSTCNDVDECNPEEFFCPAFNLTDDRSHGHTYRLLNHPGADLAPPHGLRLDNFTISGSSGGERFVFSLSTVHLI